MKTEKKTGVNPEVRLNGWLSAAGWTIDAALLLIAGRWIAGLARIAASTPHAKALALRGPFVVFNPDSFSFLAAAVLFLAYFILIYFFGLPSPGLAALGRRRLRKRDAPPLLRRAPQFLYALPYAPAAPFLAPFSPSGLSWTDQRLDYVLARPASTPERPRRILLFLFVLDLILCFVVPAISARQKKPGFAGARTVVFHETGDARNRSASKVPPFESAAALGKDALRAYAENRVKIDRSYSGKFRAHPAFHNMADSLKPLALKTLERIYDKTGLAPARNSTIWILFRDGESSPIGDDPFGMCRGIPDGGANRPVIVLFAEAILSRSHDLESLLAHEMMHAVQQTLVGPAEFRAMPAWFVEGSAVYVENDPDRRAEIAAAAMRVNGRDILDGLDARQFNHQWDDYGEDYLALSYFTAQIDPVFIRNLFLAMRDGEEPERWLKKKTGRDWAGLSEEYKQTASAFLHQNTFGPALARHQQADALLASGKIREAYELALDLAKDRENSFWGARAEFLLAQARMELGEYKTAEHAFRDLAARHADMPFAHQAAYDEAYSRFRQGDCDAAIELLSAFIELHPFSPLKYDALFNRAECRLKTYKYDKAIEDARKVRMEFPMFAEMPSLEKIETEATEKERKRKTEPQPF